MKLDMGSAAVGGSAAFEAVIGARDVKWYKGHYLKLNMLLVCDRNGIIERAES
jgi:hypothetical protein